jgi:nicotinamide riboside kinase
VVKTLKIVCTGPESSGKTSLAQGLASELGTEWAPEFARFFVAGLGRPYRHQDLLSIAKGQTAWEEWYAERSPDVLICDTDWSVLHIWEQVKYGQNTSILPPFPPLDAAQRLYLLCQPDFEWQPDPLREHPEERDSLFTRYERLLHTSGMRYLTIAGAPEQRIEKSLAWIRQFY